jgi:hypothetical protein
LIRIRSHKNACINFFLYHVRQNCLQWLRLLSLKYVKLTMHFLNFIGTGTVFKMYKADKLFQPYVFHYTNVAVLVKFSKKSATHSAAGIAVRDVCLTYSTLYCSSPF